MVSTVTVNVLDIHNDKDSLKKVKLLWRNHSSTLGFFTSGAFHEYATKKQILLANNDAGECIGYLLYRISKHAAHITHLCVDNKCRNSGVARKLVERLKIESSYITGIGLYCRRDFEISEIWPKFGFVPVSEKIGRSHDGKPLTYWWHDNSQPSLLTKLSNKKLKGKLCTVIDANIFFDLESHNDIESTESKSLIADWLHDSIELCLTEEIFVEIDRNSNSEERTAQRKRAHSFTIVHAKHHDYSVIEMEIKTIFLFPFTKQDESDIRQLSRAITADADFFVTRDDEILNLSDQIYDRYDIYILRPTDLIIQIDYLNTESAYRPIRLAGSLSEFRLIKAGEIDDIINTFQNHHIGEKKAAFRRVLSEALTSPKDCKCYVICDSQSSYLGLITYKYNNDNTVEIALFRAIKSKLENTIYRYLLGKATRDALQRKNTLVTIIDRYLSDSAYKAIYESDFIMSKGRSDKVIFDLTGKPKLVSTELQNFSHTNKEIQLLINHIGKELNKQSISAYDIYRVEKLLWPIKIDSDSMPTYIVPIKPGWAKDLFDEGIANEDLFGARSDLALQQEGVYYRSKRPNILSAPARILWYVSGDSIYMGGGYIRACSLLNDIIIGKPKDLYRRFRRLGVYEWRNVYGLAKNDTENEIMAIKFSHTELFSNPIPWNLLKTILLNNSIMTQLQSPARIYRSTFFDIYKSGHNNDKKTS